MESVVGYRSFQTHGFRARVRIDEEPNCDRDRHPMLFSPLQEGAQKIFEIVKRK